MPTTPRWTSGDRRQEVRLTINSNWGGILKQYGLSEVRFFSVPVFAREPSPIPGASHVDVDVALSWRAGREAASTRVPEHDKQAVTDGTAAPRPCRRPVRGGRGFGSDLLLESR